MLRRNFLASLAGLPFLGWLKPAEVAPQLYHVLKFVPEEGYPISPPQSLVNMNKQINELFEKMGNPSQS